MCATAGSSAGQNPEVGSRPAGRFALLIVGIWSEPNNATFWKVPATPIAVCVAVALVGLAGLATLPERLRWTFTAAEAHVSVQAVVQSRE